MEFDKIPTTLDVTLYGNMEQVSDVMSKCRVRIFYKGMNRNRTYISEDFANQLISSLAYVPVKGIFSKEDVDFTDHGEDNTDGRIYGIVPADSNFAWEDHMDDDGVVRSYACADVLLFTGLYPEAKLIPTESQSMEIFRGNLKGEWRISEEDKQPYYYFMKGCLVGLQVLGMDTEPCFEGAAFFSHINPDEIKVLVDYIRNTTSKKEEIKTMDKTLFRISDNQKSMMIESLANPNFNEEGGWVQDRIVIDVYDDYEIRCGVDEPEHINDFRDAGLPARHAIVTPGSVRRTHEWLQCRHIVIDPARTPRAYKEFTEYEHDVDEKTGEVIDGYPDRNNHWIDAVRYATSPLSMKRGNSA